MTESGRPEVEIERAYDVGDDAVLPDLGALRGLVVEPHGTAELHASYLDTTPPTLLAARVVVRRRTGGHDAGWHVKAAAERGRIERRWPLGAEDAPPPALLDAVEEAAGTRPGELSPLATIRTTRTTTVLLDDVGVPVVEIADDRVLATDERALVDRAWREWEVELLPGAPAGADDPGGLLDVIERELLAAGAVPSSSPAKIGRALGAG